MVVFLKKGRCTVETLLFYVLIHIPKLDDYFS